jgi:NAD(P)-dependent dehydrogenase (short-subunit alcohol dehydrogenase family)
MTADLTGKIVLVTGGGNGIGAASCRAFANAGARVAVIDRDGDAAARVAAEIGGGATGHALDVADGAAFARLASEIAAQRGGIDVLVNSAGTITRQTIAAMPVADWDRVIAVNLRGPFNGTQAVIPHMRARGGGAIVNIASVAGRRISFGGGANYSASKAGLLGFTRHAAYELAPDNIRSTRSAPARPRPRSAAVSCHRRIARPSVPARSRSAAWSSRRTSPMPSCSWRATCRACAPASRSTSMAAC